MGGTACARCLSPSPPCPPRRWTARPPTAPAAGPTPAASGTARRGAARPLAAAPTPQARVCACGTDTLSTQSPSTTHGAAHKPTRREGRAHTHLNQPRHGRACACGLRLQRHPQLRVLRVGRPRVVRHGGHAALGRRRAGVVGRQRRARAQAARRLDDGVKLEPLKAARALVGPPGAAPHHAVRALRHTCRQEVGRHAAAWWRSQGEGGVAARLPR